MKHHTMKITFLGTGTSHGIPMIGCDCAVCRSTDPRDRRYRASVALQINAGKVILIDTPPELRLAVIENKISRVDAVLFTHAHADHIVGLDDLRRFNDLIGATISCYGNERTIKTLRQCFGYAEVPYQQAAMYRPSLQFNIIDAPSLKIFDIEIIPVPLMHGVDEILGFRIGNFAYCTDCSGIPEKSLALLEGLDVLVIGALRHEPHPAHFSLSEALEAISQLKPSRAFLTHISHHLPHHATEQTLPENVRLAYDGLVLEV